MNQEEFDKKVETQCQAFIEKLRPDDLEIRKKLDFGYSYEKRSIILFEIRPKWKNNPKDDDIFDYDNLMELPFVKCTFIKSRNIWKIYWMRASGKWENYQPHPYVKRLSTFFNIVDKDEYGCFFG